ncbi:ABC transporter permease [Halalkalibacter oceani]|uniref:ABC transporter permease n=1 Tax=Halalkalibacter oceani TaxID=1653776 RepID=UPI0033981ED3
MIKIEKSRWRRPALCCALLLMAIVIAMIVTPYDPYHVDVSNKLQKPSSLHWFGTDHLGRDVLTRLVYGAPFTLLFPFLVLVISAIIGSLFGLVSSYVGGKVDSAMTAVMDAFSSIPNLLLAIAITGLLGPGLLNTLLAISISWWVQYARIVRSVGITIRREPYMLAAQLSGSFGGKLIYRHLLPNTKPLVRELFFLDMGAVILLMSSLSFLGLGAQPPLAEWGSMMFDGKSYLQIAPWITLIPAAAITVFVMLFYLIGRGLQSRE